MEYDWLVNNMYVNNHYLKKNLKMKGSEKANGNMSKVSSQISVKGGEVRTEPENKISSY